MLLTLQPRTLGRPPESPLLALPGLFPPDVAPPGYQCKWSFLISGLGSPPSETLTGKLMALPTLHGILLLFPPLGGGCGSPSWEVPVSYCKNMLCPSALKSGCISFLSVASIPYPVPSLQSSLEPKWSWVKFHILIVELNSKLSEVFRHQPDPCKKALSPFGQGFSWGLPPGSIPFPCLCEDVR